LLLWDAIHVNTLWRCWLYSINGTGLVGIIKRKVSLGSFYITRKNKIRKKLKRTATLTAAICGSFDVGLAELG